MPDLMRRPAGCSALAQQRDRENGGEQDHAERGEAVGVAHYGALCPDRIADGDDGVVPCSRPAGDPLRHRRLLQVAERQGLMLTHLTRWYDNADILKMATSINGELLAMSGPRNPYQGKLGIIEEDALADLLVVDGNPINDIELVARPDKNLMLIMKDGKIYKDTQFAMH